MRQINWGFLLGMVFCFVFWTGVAVVVEKAEASEVATAYSADRYPGQQPADAKLKAEIERAEVQWAHVGIGVRDDFPLANVNTCPNGITGWLTDSLADSDTSHAYGRGANCTVFVNKKLIRVQCKAQCWGVDLLECLVVQHEVGHAFGLQHADQVDYPIMSVSSEDYSSYCWQFVPRWNPEQVCRKKRVKVAVARRVLCGGTRVAPR